MTRTISIEYTRLMFRKLSIFSLFPFFLHGLTAILNEPQATPTPWFTGPLLAPSPTVVPAGSWSIEPYFFAIKTPAAYDKEWQPQSNPTLWTVSCQIPVWVGLTNWLDLQIQPTLNWNHKQGSGAHWSLGDLVLQLEFQLYRDSLPHKTWLPSIKFALREGIPTGKYRNLDPKKSSTDLGGSGSWNTAFELVFGRIFQLSNTHFLTSRLGFTYTLPSPVHVKGFNAYGGGLGANGTAYPGKNFQVDLGLEISLSRNWAFALDILGVWQSRSKFSGNPGIANVDSLFAPISPELPSEGSLAINDVKSYIQYSLAPALEYNFNENFGIIGGTWFTIAGKNVSEFYSAVIAINYYK